MGVVTRRTFLGAPATGGGGGVPVIPVVADEDARDAMFTDPDEGQLVVVEDSDGDGLLQLQTYAGGGWEWVGPQVDYPTSVPVVADETARDAIPDPTQGHLVVVGDQLQVHWDNDWIPVAGGFDPADYVAKTGDQTMAGALGVGGELSVGGALGVTGNATLASLNVGPVTGSSAMQLVRATTAHSTYLANVTGDVNYRYQVFADGKTLWGSGAGALDTNLYRSAADTLKTDDSMIIGGALNVTGAVAVGGVLTAGRMVINTYADATARDAAMTSPAAGTVVYVTGTGFQVYTGSTWSTIGPSSATGWVARGTWSSANTYAVGDVVNYFGAIYVNKVASGTPTEMFATGSATERTFETTAGSWNESAGNHTRTRDTSLFHSGAASLKLTLTYHQMPASTSNPSNTVSVVSGTSYIFRAWVYATKAFTANLASSIGGSSSGVAVSANTWTELSWTFTAPSTGSATLTVATSTGLTTGDAWWIDDVSFVAAPGFNPADWDTLAPTADAAWLDNIERLGVPKTAGGEFVRPRNQWFEGTIAVGSTQVALTYFYARKTETITTISMFTTGTAAAATPTTVRIGVYSVASNGDLTLIASTANDTALLAAINTKYTKALSASWNKVAGTVYAIGLLVISSAALPTMVMAASNYSSVPIIQATYTEPRMSAAVNGQSSLPASVAVGSLAWGTSRVIVFELNT